MDNELNFRNFLEKNVIQGGKRLINGSNVNSKPLFSIITVVYNNERFLEETIKSVLKQKFQNFEYIIIDGGSSDKTLDIIKRYDRQIDYWISEKDKGIYDAFNKGMSLAKGDFIGIVNSDDTYMDNALEIIAKYIKELNNKEIDFIFGSVKKHWGVLYGYRPEKIYYSWGFYSSHSTGFFLRRSSAKKIGLYNINYKYHADYDYFYRMIVKKKMKGTSTKKDEITGNFRRGGYSSKINFRKLFMEELKIRYNHGQNIILIIIIFVYKSIKNFKKILFS
jgi:glycosyltransferase involved in cell wall biosynthesis